MKKIKITSKTRLGIFGSGQLARMTTHAAQRLGYQVSILNDRPGAEPAAQSTSSVYQGKWDDLESLVHFAKQCDVLTLENEFISANLLKEVQRISGTPIFPTPETFSLIEDKISQKKIFEDCKIPMGLWREVHNAQEIFDAIKEWNGPVIVKAAKGGYDGYGNAFASNAEEAKQAWIKLSQNSRVLVEKKINLIKEYAVTVARNSFETVVYPVVDTVQENHICTHVIAPADLDHRKSQLIQKYADEFINHIDGRGIFSIEFFEDETGHIMINEPAPRPHNSAHYTMNACVVDQFENHVRAVLDLPLGNPDMRVSYALMINLLGQSNGSTTLEVPESLMEADAHIHLYGKIDCKPGRKMGHINLLGKTRAELEKYYQSIKEDIHL